MLEVELEDIPTDLSIGRILNALFALCHPSTIGEYSNTMKVFETLLGDALWEPPTLWKDDDKPPVVM
jgi:hypothetical protein